MNTPASLSKRKQHCSTLLLPSGKAFRKAFEEGLLPRWMGPKVDSPPWGSPTLKSGGGWSSGPLDLCASGPLEISPFDLWMEGERRLAQPCPGRPHPPVYFQPNAGMPQRDFVARVIAFGGLVTEHLLQSRQGPFQSGATQGGGGGSWGVAAGL
ncbi:unnamed protein product [Boreogadus saida]